MVTWIGASVAALFALLAEILHGFRQRRVGHLVFGPGQRGAPWTRIVPPLRAAGAGFLAWGLLTLLFDVDPMVHRAEELEEDEYRHLVLVLDVSPSMRLEDAGPDGKQSRLHRVRDLLNSMFGRISLGQFKVSVIATYNGALPVVVDTSDPSVVGNILGDLPMHFAFNAGDTRLFDGLEEAARIAGRWEPESTTVVVLSDGDTLPPTGMPGMPRSVSGVLVVGVGDPVTGTFLNGSHSRQDVSTLRQMALRLGGTYQDGNKRHVSTSILEAVTMGVERSALQQLTRREYALIAIGLGAVLLALIPLLLHLAGTRWQPGKQAFFGRNTRIQGGVPVSGAVSDDRLIGHRV